MGFRNRNIKGFITTDPFAEDPTKAFDYAGVLLRDMGWNYNNSRRWRSDDGYTIADFCNSNFSEEKFDERDFDGDMDGMIDYLARFGALVVPAANGIMIASKDMVAKEFGKGKDARRQMKDVMEGESREYQYYLDGEVYTILFQDDGDDNHIDPVTDIEFLDEWQVRDMDFTDSIGGYYGYDWAMKDAREQVEYAKERARQRAIRANSAPVADRRYSVSSGIDGNEAARLGLYGMDVGESRTVNGVTYTRNANRRRR